MSEFNPQDVANAWGICNIDYRHKKLFALVAEKMKSYSLGKSYSQKSGAISVFRISIAGDWFTCFEVRCKASIDFS
jgi:hypothetical protein